MREYVNTADLPDGTNQIMKEYTADILNKLHAVDPRLAAVILESCLYHLLYVCFKEDAHRPLLEGMVEGGLKTFENWKLEDSAMS